MRAKRRAKARKSA